MYNICKTQNDLHISIKIHYIQSIGNSFFVESLEYLILRKIKSTRNSPFSLYFSTKRQNLLKISSRFKNKRKRFHTLIHSMINCWHYLFYLFVLLWWQCHQLHTVAFAGTKKTLNRCKTIASLKRSFEWMQYYQISVKNARQLCS